VSSKALSPELAYASIARQVWIERRKAGPSYKTVLKKQKLLDAESQR